MSTGSWHIFLDPQLSLVLGSCIIFSTFKTMMAIFSFTSKQSWIKSHGINDTRIVLSHFFYDGINEM